MIRLSETWRFLGLKESFLAEWPFSRGELTVRFREYSKQFFPGYPKSKV